MTRRERIYNKYNGLCAYSGTSLERGWEIEHIKPVHRSTTGKILNPENHNENNMVPCQRAINNYKGGYPLEYFRSHLLGYLHERLKKYPRSGKGIKLRLRIERIAGYFGITEDKPFSGVFYFEQQSTGEE